MPRKQSKKVIASVAKELHEFISYAYLSMYHMMIKAYSLELDEESRESYCELVAKMITVAETPYEELNDKQKELINELALRVINNVK